MKKINKVKVTFSDDAQNIAYVLADNKQDVCNELKDVFGNGAEYILYFSLEPTDINVLVLTKPEDFPEEHELWSSYYKCVIDFIALVPELNREVYIRRVILIETNSLDNAYKQMKRIADSSFVLNLIDNNINCAYKFKWCEFLKSYPTTMSDNNYRIVKIEELNSSICHDYVIVKYGIMDCE